jgi:hypothetical protein
MKYQSVPVEQANGTSLQGYIDADYDTLVGLFSEPDTSEGYKTDAEWIIKFEDGAVATIYDYKTGKNYNGKEGLPAPRNRDWHIGGFSKLAYQHVKDTLNSQGAN